LSLPQQQYPLYKQKGFAKKLFPCIPLPYRCFTPTPVQSIQTNEILPKLFPLFHHRIAVILTAAPLLNIKGF
jgi:hypothetical protein